MICLVLLTLIVLFAVPLFASGNIVLVDGEKKGRGSGILVKNYFQNFFDVEGNEFSCLVDYISSVQENISRPEEFWVTPKQLKNILKGSLIKDNRQALGDIQIKIGEYVSIEKIGARGDSLIAFGGMVRSDERKEIRKRLKGNSPELEEGGNNDIIRAVKSLDVAVRLANQSYEGGRDLVLVSVPVPDTEDFDGTYDGDIQANTLKVGNSVATDDTASEIYEILSRQGYKTALSPRELRLLSHNIVSCYDTLLLEMSSLFDDLISDTADKKPADDVDDDGSDILFDDSIGLRETNLLRLLEGRRTLDEGSMLLNRGIRYMNIIGDIVCVFFPLYSHKTREVKILVFVDGSKSFLREVFNDQQDVNGFVQNYQAIFGEDADGYERYKSLFSRLGNSPKSQSKQMEILTEYYTDKANRFLRGSHYVDYKLSHLLLYDLCDGAEVKNEVESMKDILSIMLIDGIAASHNTPGEMKLYSVIENIITKKLGGEGLSCKEGYGVIDTLLEDGDLFNLISNLVAQLMNNSFYRFDINKYKKCAEAKYTEMELRMLSSVFSTALAENLIPLNTLFSEWGDLEVVGCLREFFDVVMAERKLYDNNGNVILDDVTGGSDGGDFGVGDDGTENMESDDEVNGNGTRRHRAKHGNNNEKGNNQGDDRDMPFLKVLQSDIEKIRKAAETFGKKIKSQFLDSFKSILSESLGSFLNTGNNQQTETHQPEEKSGDQTKKQPDDPASRRKNIIKMPDFKAFTSTTDESEKDDDGDSDDDDDTEKDDWREVRPSAGRVDAAVVTPQNVDIGILHNTLRTIDLGRYVSETWCEAGNVFKDISVIGFCYPQSDIMVASSVPFEKYYQNSVIVSVRESYPCHIEIILAIPGACRVRGYYESLLRTIGQTVHHCKKDPVKNE